MKVFRGTPRRSERAPCALTIGNFDGVHRGHRTLLAHLVRAAVPRGLQAAVMTFEPHPREFFVPERAPARVSNLRDKLDAFRASGVQRVFVMHFKRNLAQLAPEAFIDQVLLSRCDMRWLLVGADFRFGAARAGDVELLSDYAKRGVFELEIMPTIEDAGDRISSTGVRQALMAGDLPRAGALLDRPYAISSRVMHGRKLGTSLGFPTLNLRIAHAHPALRGIFAVRVHGLAERAVSGVASIGLRPTIESAGRWLLEVHLFDFAEAVYGKLVRVEFVKKLRDERKYETLGELSAAIGSDAAQARAYLNGAVAN
ncbi:MAG: bifunctional riboflavin kinase/FAD synthetase [Burkholderiaceae bacterium]|nr:bifunctional riboflavin kinase/FAD synthetase [Burkholderiaceae bacterium]